MILNDMEITELCGFTNKSENMIQPFEANLIREVSGAKVISFGTSSFGYDASLGSELTIFKDDEPKMFIDPKNFSPDIVETNKSEDFFILPPLTFALGVTKEYFSIPENILMICFGKSTLLRSGLSVGVSVVEPGFKGQITLELFNQTKFPMKLYVNEGICQFVFFKGSTPQVTYSTRNGKYMGQTGVTFPKV